MTERLPNPPPSVRRFWPRPFTCGAIGCVLLAGFLANFPGALTPHDSLERAPASAASSIVKTFDHGWPYCFARRGAMQIAIGKSKRDLTIDVAWRPWQSVLEFRSWALAANLGLWLVIAIAVGTGAQRWRSQRTRLWQFQLRDLLLLLVISAIACGWIVLPRIQHQRERIVIAQYQKRMGMQVWDDDKAAVVPGIIPVAWQGRYAQAFERVVYFRSSGDTDLACQFRQLIRLVELQPAVEMPAHLGRMPQLEALAMPSVRFPYLDATKQKTLVAQFPAMPELRRVDLWDSNVTDADLAWLAKCRNLEMIDLSNTAVGDRGLVELRGLARLRQLSLSGKRITDHGCSILAQMQSLEELSMASFHIHDAGVRELAKLRNLKKLSVSAAASKATLAELKELLPECEVHGITFPAPRL